MPTPRNQYTWTVIHNYKWWSLRLHVDQRYLGRAIAWLNRDGNLFSSDDLTAEESREYRRVILPHYRKAVTELFLPDRLNEYWAGNLEKEHRDHGHWHLIPRYRHIVDVKPGVIAGLDHAHFEDGRWGQNYAPYEPLRLDRKDLEKIRDAIAVHL